MTNVIHDQLENAKNNSEKYKVFCFLKTTLATTVLAVPTIILIGSGMTLGAIPTIIIAFALVLPATLAHMGAACLNAYVFAPSISQEVGERNFVLGLTLGPFAPIIQEFFRVSDLKDHKEKLKDELLKNINSFNELKNNSEFKSQLVDLMIKTDEALANLKKN